MAAPCCFTPRDLATLSVITAAAWYQDRGGDIRKRATTRHDTAKYIALKVDHLKTD